MGSAGKRIKIKKEAKMIAQRDWGSKDFFIGWSFFMEKLGYQELGVCYRSELMLQIWGQSVLNDL